MALDPSIALAYRPPQVNVDVPSPIQQFGQILSLRNLMQQGQTGQLELQTKMLQLQQIQQAVQERKNLADLFQNPQTQTPSPAAAPLVPSAPVQTPTPAAPQYTPVAPYTPLAPPAVTPNTPATAAPAAGPALGAATVTDPFANLPSYSDILRAAPTTGAAHIETISKARKAYWENVDQQHKAQQDHINDLATIASTVHDEPTKIAAIAEAFQRKLITPEVRDQLSSHPYNKQEWDGFNTQALDAAKRGEEARAQINQKITEEKDAFDKSMRPYQLSEAKSKDIEAGAKAETATYGSVARDAAFPKSQEEWDTFRAGVPDPALRSKIPATYSPAAQQQTVSILGQTPNERVTAAQAAANAAETAKEHAAQNAIARAHLDIARRADARAEQVYQNTYGPGANEALVGVDPKLRVQATTNAQKAADEYSKAVESTGNMQSIIDLARSGNKVAYAYAPATGVMTINTAQGIRRVNMPELKTYGGAGSAADQIEGWLGKNLTGESIPANILKNMEEVNRSISDSAAKNYDTKLGSINQNYHSNFKPAVKAAASGGAVPDAVKNVLKSAGPGIHTLSDGTKWMVAADGTVSKR